MHSKFHISKVGPHKGSPLYSVSLTYTEILDSKVRPVVTISEALSEAAHLTVPEEAQIVTKVMR